MKKVILDEAGLPKHIQVKQSLREDETAFIEAIPGIVFAVVISYVYLNVGSYMNGTLGSELTDSFGASASRSSLENNSVNTMANLSDHFDDNVDIIKIAITISVLLVPIMTIMTLRRFS
jgi:hypothetical protein